MAERSSTELIVIHCTATKPSQDIGRDEIDAWHRHQGWFGIGYHFVIRRDGAIELGRDEKVAGAHAKGFNHNSVSVALVGGSTEKNVRVAENNFTEAQFDSLNTLLKELQSNYPDAEIIGHRDLPDVKKECPAFDVKDWLEKQV